MTVDGIVSRGKKPHLLTWLNTLASTRRRLVNGAVQSPVMTRWGWPQRFSVPPNDGGEISDGHLQEVCCAHENATLCTRETCHVARRWRSFQIPLLTALRTRRRVYPSPVG